MFPILCLALVATPQEPPQPASISPERLRATLRELCSESRLAGSPAARKGADYAAREFAAAGLTTKRHAYEVYLPRQTGQSLHLILPDGRREELTLTETGYQQDPWSQREHEPPMHGLTRAGKVRGRVVFAGRGTDAEFDELKAELGGELAGCIALIRYGGLYRGLKVENASAAGCSGALLYTDREDDGDRKGRVLPDGPWRPPNGIQRGSVFNNDGDPLTPGRPALPGVTRDPVLSAEGLVQIPSLPIGYGNAGRLFGAGGRPQKPGKLAATVEIEVLQDPALVEIENVIAWIEGAREPDEWVIFGGHRDAWGFGAVDNGTGIAVLLELARVCGAAAEQGWRPERSIAFATWDAEEWGLVGSTEWVEEFVDELRSNGVAYVNMDAVVSGPEFSASCTPGLTATLRRACADELLAVPATLGTPGGGSDHVPFLELAGMEVLNFGFGGGHGSYHSALDTPYIVERFLDPDFGHHARATRLALGLAKRLSRADAELRGAAQWLAQADLALRQLDIPAAAKERLDAALRAAGTESEILPADGHRFMRAFLPDDPAARSVLWQTNGYGADWFPEVVAAQASGRGLERAIDRLVAALGRLRAAAHGPSANTGR